MNRKLFVVVSILVAVVMSVIAYIVFGSRKFYSGSLGDKCGHNEWCRCLGIRLNNGEAGDRGKTCYGYVWDCEKHCGKC